MIQSKVYCGRCAVEHPPDAPHCKTCTILLTGAADIAAGSHPACAAMVAREQRLYRPEVGCPDCGALTVDPDASGLCPACHLKAGDSRQEAAFRRLEATGRLDQAEASSVQPGPAVPPAAPPADYAAALAAEVEARTAVNEEEASE